MPNELLGRKVGMTQIYKDDGVCVPVTVIQTGPCTVTQVKSKNSDGYSAIQIAFGARRKKNATRARLGHLVPKVADDRKKELEKGIKDLESVPELIREIGWDGKEEIKVGDQIGVDIFDDMEKVDVIGLSKGRGFMSAIQRWRFHRQPASHGCSDRERAPGGIGGGKEPGKTGGVVKGKKMGGHWGTERVTVRNMPVAHIDKQKNLLMVHGGVPGPNGGLVVVKEARWVRPKVSTVKPARQKKGGR